MSYFTTTQQQAIDRDNRQQAIIGIPMSATLETMMENINNGEIGIQSNAADVDAIAAPGRFLSRDKQTGPGTSLLFAWLAGLFLRNGAVQNIAAGSLSLAASSTNYVELDLTTGVVSANTGGFTTGRYPLWTVVAGVSSYADAAVTTIKPLIQVPGPRGVSPATASTALATKTRTKDLGPVAATASFYLDAPNAASTVTGVRLFSSGEIAGDDSNYWTFALVNLGPTGTGTQALLASGPITTTKATGGITLSPCIQAAISLASTTLAIAANDVLMLTLTKTGTPATITDAKLVVDFLLA